MPKSKQKRKVKNAGVGIDFKKARHKVGRKLPKALNATDTNFKSKSITLPAQTVGDSKVSAVTHKNLTLKELLGQSGHYSSKVRAEALRGLAELFKAHTEELKRQTGPLLEKLSDRIADPDKDVRAALRQLLSERILPTISGMLLTPFLPLLMAHICSAMTHLDNAIRLDALGFLEALTVAAPGPVCGSYLLPALRLYSNLLSPSVRSRSVAARSIQSLVELLQSLRSFLSQSANASEHDVGGGGGHMGALNGSGCIWISHSELNQAAKANAAFAGPVQQVAAPDDSAWVVLYGLASHLLGAWAELAPTALEHAESNAPLEGMQAVLESLCLILQLMSRQPHSKGQIEKLAGLIIKKVALLFPMSAPPTSCSTAKLHAVAQQNLANMQLLTSLLEGSVQVPGGQEDAWTSQLLDYFVAVLARGELVPAGPYCGEGTQLPSVPVDAYTTALSGVQRLLPTLPGHRRQELIRAVTALSLRSSAKSATKAACLRFMAGVMSKPSEYLLPDVGEVEAAVSAFDVSQWLQGLPKLLWEVGSSRPETSRLALRVLLDAARFRGAAGEIGKTLAALQPSLALFYCTATPAKNIPDHRKRGDCSSSPARLLSRLSRLPFEAQVLAVDLLYYLPPLEAGLLKSLRLLCASGLLQPNLTARLMSVVAAKLSRNGRQEALLDYLMELVERIRPSRGSTQPDALDLGIAQEMAGVEAGRTLAVLPHLEERLLKAVGSDKHPVSRAAALCSIALVLRMQKSQAVAPAGTAASRTENAGNPAQSAAAGCQKSIPQRLLQALPLSLAEAVVYGWSDSEQPVGSSQQQVVDSLLSSLPCLLQPFLHVLPQACNREETAGSQAVKTAERGEALAVRAELAAVTLTRLCEDYHILQLLADCPNDLQATTEAISTVAISLASGTQKAASCAAACRRLQATVRRVAGDPRSEARS